MSFKGFSIFSSGGHFFQWSRTILEILVEGPPEEYFCENILKSGRWPRRRCYLKKLLMDGQMDKYQSQ